MSEIVLTWDLDDDPQGNVRHLAEHGISKDEVREVLENPTNSSARSRLSGEDVTFGYTATGRYLIVVWSHVDDDPLTVYPITVYDVPEPRTKPSKRSGRKR